MEKFIEKIKLPITRLVIVAGTDPDNPIGIPFTLFSLCNRTVLLIRTYDKKNASSAVQVRKKLFTFLFDHDYIIHADNWKFSNELSEEVQRQDTSMPEEHFQYSYFAWKVKDEILRAL